MLSVGPWYSLGAAGNVLSFRTWPMDMIKRTASNHPNFLTIKQQLQLLLFLIFFSYSFFFFFLNLAALVNKP